MFGTPIEISRWDFPKHEVIAGQYVRLEPLSMTHLDDLWQAAHPAPDSFAYLRYGPFACREALSDLLVDLSTRADQPFWAVIGPDQKATGWLSICDVYPADGAFEIGSIWFSPALQGTRTAREAIFLLMCAGMDDMRYERLVWRCQAQNARSFAAALTLGFVHEGTWRNAAVVKGWQRDIAWFSILRAEWPAKRSALELWLSPSNFGTDGRQILRLQDVGHAHATAPATR